MINGPQLIMQCQNGGANVGIGVQRGICNEIIKLSSNTTGHYYYIAKGEGEQAAMSLKMSRLNFDTLIIQYNAAIRKVQRLQDLVTHGQRNWEF